MGVIEKSIERKVELKNCNFVKSILMILIVLYHSILYWKGDWFIGEPVFEAISLNIVADWLNSFHIYGFVLVSGYIFYYIKYENERYQKFQSFVINKVKRLIVPYIFVSIIWVIPISGYFFNYDTQDIINNYLLGKSPGQLWFLLMLFWVFLIVWIMSNYLQKSNTISIFLAIGFYGLGIVAMRFIPNIFMILQAFSFIPVFIIGFKIRQYGSGIVKNVPILGWVIIDIGLFFIYEYINISNNEGLIWTIINLGITFVLHTVGAIMIFVVLQKIANYIQWEKKPFIYISESSMGVYLFHQQIVYVFIYWVNGRINPYLNAFVNFIGAMLISLIITFILRKFRVTRILLGEKS